MPPEEVLLAHIFDQDDRMENPRPLAPRLDACRNMPESRGANFDALIQRLQTSGAVDGAPGPGAVLPDFALPDARRPCIG